MSGLTLIIDRRGARLSLSDSGILRVQYGEESHRVGLHALQQLLLLGEVELTTRVVRACLEAGVSLALLPRRGRGETVHLFPPGPTAFALRHAQHLHYHHPASRLRLARLWVIAKLHQQQLWLDAHGLGGADLERLVEAAQTAPDPATLMGMEGAGSARYFEHWRQLWQAPWQFEHRNRRPPRDPINALLSLSYTLALHSVGRQATLRGLEPAVGFLHTPLRGRPALALDLLEPLRPWVDQWVWQWVQTERALTPEQFDCNPTEGCRLNRDGRALYFAAWFRAGEDWLRAPRRSALALLLRALRRPGEPGAE
jgi:CRISPR-associated protein Cas1